MPINAAAAALLLLSTATMAAPTTRTVHVTVTDGKGQPVSGLTPADLVVKEGGKEYQIATLEPASARMRLALAVEERLIADSSIRLGLFEFVKRVAGTADISLMTIGLSNRVLVDYTSDLSALVDVLNKLTLNPGRDSNVAEGVYDLVTQFIADRPARPVLVVVAVASGPSSVEPRNVFDKLAESGATFHSVTFVGAGGAPSMDAISDERGREQVLGDGPKQSGGRNIGVTVSAAVPRALQQVADDLLAQYVVTYTLPDGVKPNKRFSISSKKRGLTLRAPSAIPDR